MPENENKHRFFKQNRQDQETPVPFGNLQRNTPLRKLPQTGKKERGEGKRRLPGFLRVRYDGRELIRLGALLLLFLSAYELHIRLDDLRRIISGIRYACAELGVSDMKFLSLVFEAKEMQEYLGILVYLLLCLVLSVLGIILGNRPKAAAFVLLPLTAGVLIAGFFPAGTLVFDLSALFETVKLVPFLLILVGTAVNLLEEKIAKKYEKDGSFASLPR